ncbi:MAG: bifunctional glutamate N-acetyltransferase/amino-acid acetyltransferase ArgJ [Thermodesulfobacteriota bacterium]
MNKSEEYKVPGFKAAGIHCEIKKDGSQDLALIYTEAPAKVAGVFTTNKIKSLNIPLDQERVKAGWCQAVIVNSGCANACVGERGYVDAREMTLRAAQALGIEEEDVLVASTGKIGVPLPVDKIKTGIPPLKAKLDEVGWHDAALAIMTTDTFPKLVLEKGNISGKEVTLLGVAKGAGMIMPDMATMLAFFCTDVVIESDALNIALKEAVAATFNMITVDGETSTNDTVLILANEEAGNNLIVKRNELGYRVFYGMLERACERLARMIVKDGEGATKLLTFKVKGVEGFDKAKRLAFRVANSLLVKTAFFGGDPNWGRIMSALGSAGVDIDESIDIYINGLKIVENGRGTDTEDVVRQGLKNREIDITIDLKEGVDEARVLTTDLSSNYVKINASLE